MRALQEFHAPAAGAILWRDYLRNAPHDDMSNLYLFELRIVRECAAPELLPELREYLNRCPLGEKKLIQAAVEEIEWRQKHPDSRDKCKC